MQYCRPPNSRVQRTSVLINKNVLTALHNDVYDKSDYWCQIKQMREKRAIKENLEKRFKESQHSLFSYCSNCYSNSGVARHT